jgi:hypothetical protein
VRANPFGQAVVHRTNLDIGFEHPKAAFNIGQTFVALHNLWRRCTRIGHPGSTPNLEIWSFLTCEVNEIKHLAHGFSKFV